MKYYVQLAIYRQDDEGSAASRTMLRGISHNAESEKDAYDVFDQVTDILKRIYSRRASRDGRQKQLFEVHATKGRPHEEARKAG